MDGWVVTMQVQRPQLRSPAPTTKTKKLGVSWCACDLSAGVREGRSRGLSRQPGWPRQELLGSMKKSNLTM